MIYLHANVLRHRHAARICTLLHNNPRISKSWSSSILPASSSFGLPTSSKSQWNGANHQWDSPRCYSVTTKLFDATSNTPKDGSMKLKKKKNFIPRKAAITVTEEARVFFKGLLASNPEKAGIMLNYQQASSGQPRMVFSFSFVIKDDLSPLDEGVSLEVLEDGSPRLPNESRNDGLPKLYVHHNAFLKVLGATIDVNMENITPILYDREGNVMDPSA